MTSKRKKGPSFHKHTPGSYTADTHGWCVFTARQRGIYNTLIIYLGLPENNGWMVFDLAVFERLCNYTGEDFKGDFGVISDKFIFKKDKIGHKKLLEELRAARKSIKQKQLAGRASGEARKRVTNSRLGDAEQSNITKANITKEDKLLIAKAAIAFDDKLNKLFGPLSVREQKTFSNIRFYIISLNNLEKFHVAKELMMESSEWAHRTKHKTKDDAKRLFVSKVKKRLGWKPKGFMMKNVKGSLL